DHRRDAAVRAARRLADDAGRLVHPQLPRSPELADGAAADPDRADHVRSGLPGADAARADVDSIAQPAPADQLAAEGRAAGALERAALGGLDAGVRRAARLHRRALLPTRPDPRLRR